MKKVIVFGSGGFAKELLCYLEDSVDYEVICVVSTEPFKNSEYANRYHVRQYVPRGTDAEYFLAVAEPWIKRKIVSENDDRWGTFIHPSCNISKYAKIGKGCILAPQAIVVGDAVLGRFVFMNTNATVGHDSTVGDYSTLMPNTEVCGNVAVGQDVLIGIGAYVLPHNTVGEGAVIAAGAIATKSVPPGVTVYGVPAKEKSA